MNEFLNPRVMQETSAGYKDIRIVDIMFQQRKLFLSGPIDAGMAQVFIANLLHLEEEDPGEPIELHINSPGGEVFSGMLIYDVMKSISSPITTVCSGLAASMASFLFVIGEERKIYENSKILLHSPYTFREERLNMNVITEIHDNLKDTYDKMKEILLKNSHCTSEDIDMFMAKDTLIDANKAIEYGFADEIIPCHPSKKR